LSYTEASPFVRLLGKSGRVKIVDVLLGKHYETMTASEIAQLADIAESTVNRNIDPLIEYGVVEKVGEVSGTQQYSLNKDSPVSQTLARTREELLKHRNNIPVGDSSKPPLSRGELQERINLVSQEIDRIEESLKSDDQDPLEFSHLSPARRARTPG
jgi:uncharacterized small protein (DUF1192 family)